MIAPIRFGAPLYMGFSRHFNALTFTARNCYERVLHARNFCPPFPDNLLMRLSTIALVGAALYATSAHAQKKLFQSVGSVCDAAGHFPCDVQSFGSLSEQSAWVGLALDMQIAADYVSGAAGDRKMYGDPVVGDGEFFVHNTDVSFPGFGIKFEFSRSYRSGVTFYGPLGYGWDHSYDQRLRGAAPGKPYCDGTIDYQDGKLGTVRFKPAPVYSPIPGINIVSTVMTAEGVPLTLEPDPSGQFAWLMKDPEGIRSYFDKDGYLAAVRHPAGPQMVFSWEGSDPKPDPAAPPQVPPSYGKRLVTVVDTTNRIIHLNYVGSFLQCLSLTSDCTTPLVSYTVEPAAGAKILPTGVYYDVSARLKPSRRPWPGEPG